MERQRRSCQKMKEGYDDDDAVDPVTHDLFWRCDLDVMLGAPQPFRKGGIVFRDAEMLMMMTTTTTTTTMMMMMMMMTMTMTMMMMMCCCYNCYRIVMMMMMMMMMTTMTMMICCCCCLWMVMMIMITAAIMIRLMEADLMTIAKTKMMQSPSDPVIQRRIELWTSSSAQNIFIFIHSFNRSFIQSFIRSFTYSFIW